MVGSSRVCVCGWVCVNFLFMLCVFRYGLPITVYGSDYVAIRWQGKIRPDYTEPFVFYANMDDGARVWIDKVLIADSWGVCCNETWGTANLTKDFLHDIIVEYKQMRGM